MSKSVIGSVLMILLIARAADGESSGVSVAALQASSARCESLYTSRLRE